MQAWQLTRARDPDYELRLVDVPTPEAAPDRVTIDVSATTATVVDLLLCQGKHQSRPELPMTPGLEVSGTIADIGRGVSGLSIGQRVMALPELPFGGLAERCRARPTDVFSIPDALSDASAAAMLTAYQTSWFGLHRRARLRPDETLLVHGAAGGVGSAAVQLGVANGSRVVATAGGKDKVDLCRRMGADLVIDHTSEDFVEAVQDATDGRGADVIFDPVGGAVFERSQKCIAFEGRIVIVGFASGDIATLRTNHTLVKNYTVAGLFWGRYRFERADLVRRCHGELMRLFEEGLIEPVVMREVPMEAAADVLASLHDGTTWGRTVIRP